MSALKDPRRELACQFFVKAGCAQGSMGEAFREAFPAQAKRWKQQTVWEAASRLFAEPQVKKRVAELLDRVAEVAQKRFDVDAEYVLRRLVEIDKMDVADILADDGSFKPIRDWPLVWRQFVSGVDLAEMFEGRGDERELVGILNKLKWPDKVRNLELLGKHVTVAAFRERHELTGPGGGPIRAITVGMSAQEAAEAYADTLHDK